MDWKAVEAEAVEDFRSLLRFPTVNPPGDEGPAADFVVERLRDAGLEPRVLSSDGRPNVIVRLEGDGSLDGGPLLLTGHLDVVPVEAESWTHPPFDAVIEGDYLFGRGAVDMKNMVAMCLTTVRQLALQKVPLGRDIIFAAIADEEAGCDYGSRFLVEEHPDDVRAECMIGEFGAFSVDVRGKRFYPIQVAEKGTCHLILTARGEPGHGSMPRADSAVVRLAEAIVKLGRKRLPQHRVATVEAFVDGMAQAQGFPTSLILRRLLQPAFSGIILDRLLPADSATSFAAMLSNTASATMLAAGEKINVIPGRAEAHLDGRLLPGQTPDDLVREVRTVLGPKIDVAIHHSHVGRENPSDHPLFEHLVATLKRHDPDGHPLPFMAPGFTDAAFFGRVVPHCFGFSPVRFPAEDKVVVAKLPHAHDERIHVPGFKWGLRVLHDAVVGHCARNGAAAS